MKIIAIAFAFVASAALANPGATGTTDAHAAPHGKAMKAEKKTTTTVKETTTATTAHCSEADAKAGKCTPEVKK